MGRIMALAQNVRNNTAMQNNGIGVAGAAAGLLVGTVTGGIGIAAAGLLAKESAGAKAEKAENIQDIAQQRRALMSGIYDAKGCQGPMKPVPAVSSPMDDVMRMARAQPAAGDEKQGRPAYNR